MPEVKLSLLENAESFLDHSLSQAIIAEENPQNWKYAILNLVQSIELSLKELLRREHKILIYRNVDKPKDTVSLEYAVARLKKIAKIKFNTDDLDTILLASHYRNQIVHYEFSFKEEEIKSIFAKLLGFLQSLFNSHFNKNLDEIIGNNVWKEAIQIIEYATELQKRAEERFKNEDIEENLIMVCRSCYQEAFVIQDDINTCYVCGNIDDIAQCDGCEEYFYWDEVQGSHEYDDKIYCEECLHEINITSSHYDYDDTYF